MKNFEGQQKTLNSSHEQRMLYHLHVIHLIVKRFKNGTNAPSLTEISQKLDIPTPMCRSVADHSIRAGLIVESIDPKLKEGVFTPAIDISKLTLGFVISRIESLGELKRGTQTSEEYLQIKLLYNEMEDAMFKSPSNKHIADI